MRPWAAIVTAEKRTSAEFALRVAALTSIKYDYAGPRNALEVERRARIDQPTTAGQTAKELYLRARRSRPEIRIHRIASSPASGRPGVAASQRLKNRRGEGAEIMEAVRGTIG